MTGSADQTIPQDFAVLVSKKKGLPSRPKPRGSAPPAARIGGVARTPGPLALRARTATGGNLSANEETLMKHTKKPTRHLVARLMARMALLAGMIASFTFPVLAQDRPGPAPENAQPRSYGDGWVCDIGYRVEGNACLALVIPEHAHPTGQTYGTGWECSRGFEESGGTSCTAIPVPANAFLRSSGYGWQCERGFREERDACVPIVLPEHAYLTDDNTETGWTCDRSYEPFEGNCRPIAVPANAYLTNAAYGDAWACERGFLKIEERCNAIVVPANAFFAEASYGPGWTCERGYQPLNGYCVAIDLPVNAHIDHSGNRWSCNRGFQQSDETCILGQ